MSGLVQLALVYVFLPDRSLDKWSSATVPTYVLGLLLFFQNAFAFIQSISFMAQMSFFSRVARQSPNNATVMTLLNALTNLGSMWPRPIILKAMEAFTTRQCLSTAGGGRLSGEGVGGCMGPEASFACKALGGECATDRDGYPILVAVGTLYCLAWWLLMKNRVVGLGSAPASGWAVARS